MRSSPTAPLALLVVLLAPVAAAQDPPRYTALVLQPPAGVASSANTLNASGECAGDFLNTSSGYFDGVVWDAAGSPSALSALYGLVEAGAFGIEDDGTIVGSGSLVATEVSHGLVVAPDGSLALLPSLAGDTGVVSAAFDVNASGTVVGRSSLVPTPFWLTVPADAVTWEDGAVTSLGTLGGFFAVAERINDAGTIIGRSNTADSDFARGFVWDPVQGMREITPFEPGGTGQVDDLNEAGVICGSATVGTTRQACLWPDPDRPPELLPVLPGDTFSEAVAIDEAGLAVGFASSSPGVDDARLWTNGSVHDLDDLLDEPLPFGLAAALDVNEHGQILAVSDFLSGSGFVHVVLTPRPRLTGTPASVSVGAGGTHVMELDAAPDLGGSLYLVLGSISGTSPGLPVRGLVLPLNPDVYFELTFLAPNAPPLAGTLGLLDEQGDATASFTLPAGSPPSLAGIGIHHASVVADPVTFAIVETSNAVPLTLEP